MAKSGIVAAKKLVGIADYILTFGQKNGMIYLYPYMDKFTSERTYIMIYIHRIYLDGTCCGPWYETAYTCEFSECHATPTLSWAIGGGESGDRQVAYTLTAAIDGDTVYDTGRVESSVQAHPLTGFNFPAGKTATLTLTVESATATTEPATVVLFNATLDAFRGCWITSERDEGNRVLHFTKAFSIDKPVREAHICYCGLGYHSCYLNRQMPSHALLDPAHSNYAKTCYYRAEEVTRFLQDGENRLEFEVAPGWRKNGSEFMFSMLGERKIEFYGDQVLWADLCITYKDGTVEHIVTDEDWQCAPSWRTSEIFNGETADARLLAKADDEGVRFPVRIAEAPGGEMRPMTLQAIGVRQFFEPVEITTPKPGVFVVDFGQNIAGVVELTFEGVTLTEGQVITLRHAEELDEDGMLYTAPLRGAAQTDTYIAAGRTDIDDCWVPKFTYHGFRYCEVTGLDRLDKDMISACLLHTDMENDSRFSSGSAIVNAIQQNLLMTERDNMHSILTDCPQRDERMAWMNDATVRFEETPYNFDASRMFPKIMQDIFNEQRAEGQFTCCSPYIYGALPADPVCSSYLMAAKEALMHYGELGAVDEFFDGMAAWEDYLLSRSPDGTVDYSYYGDWAGPSYACVTEEFAVNTATPGVLMSTGYSYLNCKLLVDFARRTGRTEAEAKYTAAAERVQKAFLDKWFDPATAKVAGGSMGAQAFSLWLGILPDEYVEAAARVMHEDVVAHNYKFTTGNLNTRYLMDMLTKYGYIEDAWAIITSEEYPSFGFMIQHEATTVWERFELKKEPGMNSHNHPMYGAVGYWFYAYLGGIIPTEPGFSRVSIKPYFPEKLLSAHAVVDSIMGEISVRWHKKYGKLYLNVQVPFGVTADVDFGGKVETVGAGYHVFEKEL